MKRRGHTRVGENAIAAIQKSVHGSTAVMLMGMHRSGTSLLMGLLHALGLDLGPHLMLPAHDNPKGHYESIDIMQIHERLLAALGSSWDDPRPLPEDWVYRPEIQPYRQELTATIQHNYQGLGLWGVKDPRLCRLYPLWREILSELGVRVKAILLVRHFSESVTSLTKRNDMAPAQAMDLWISHVLESERLTRYANRTLVLSTALFENWLGVIRGIAEDLQVSLRLDDPDALNRASIFVSDELRHYRTPRLSGVGLPQLKLARDSYRVLEQGAREAIDESALDRLYRQWKHLQATETPVRHYLEARLLQVDQRLAEVTTENSDYVQRIQEVENRREASMAEAQRLGESLEARAQELEGVQEELSESRDEVQRRGSEWETLAVEAQGLGEALEARTQELEGTRTELSASRDEAQQLGTERETLAVEAGVLRVEVESFREQTRQIDERLSVALYELEGSKQSGTKLEAERERLEGELDQVRRRNEESLQMLAQAYQKFDELHVELQALVASRAWRLTWPLRAVNQRWRATKTGILRLFGICTRLVFKAVPLAPTAKHRLKTFVFRQFPLPVRETAAYRVWLAQQNRATVRPGFAPESDHLFYSSTLDLDAIAYLKFPTFSKPRVSIIIPVYNAWHYTYACLAAILHNTDTAIEFEVIVADDGSTDNTRAMLNQCPGIRSIRNKKNLGFLRNVNCAASFARGEYLVLLNNDTEPQPGWLAKLVETFYTHTDVGLVGCKFIYPNGSLQEAGGIVWCDASAWNYGRNADAENPAFNFVREVDYCSGAGVMIPTDLWKEIGGFDERYMPAYYEDTDLAFSVREAGRRVLYQPDSVVVHYEGVSSGTDVTSGVKGHQVINQKKFREKWGKQLTAFNLDNGTHVYKARARAQNKRSILIIEDMVPEYDKNAGAMMMWSYIQLLQDMDFLVSLLPDNRNRSEPYTHILQQRGVEVLYGWFDLEDWLQQNGADLDYILLARPDISEPYLKVLKRYSTAVLLYFTHDLHYLRELRRYELEHRQESLVESHRLRQVEQHIFNSVDAVLTPSSAEIPLISKLAPGRLAKAMPLFFFDIDTETFRSGASFDDRDTILFVGGYQHTPNVDAVNWFCDEILPAVRSKLGPVKVVLAGSNPPPEVLARAGNGVEVLGYVENLSPVFEQARVFVAPLRYGAGVKGKVITSLRYGVPVVTTSIGNEGIGLAHEDEALVADEPHLFADMVCRLYEDVELWKRLREQAFCRLEKDYSKTGTQVILEQILAQAAVFSASQRRKTTVIVG